jgi:hypothetical protein
MFDRNRKAPAAYYNTTRTHLALQRDALLQGAIQRIGHNTAVQILGGLHHEYVRIRFSERTGLDRRRVRSSITDNNHERS